MPSLGMLSLVFARLNNDSVRDYSGIDVCFHIYLYYLSVYIYMRVHFCSSFSFSFFLNIYPSVYLLFIHLSVYLLKCRVRTYVCVCFYVYLRNCFFADSLCIRMCVCLFACVYDCLLMRLVYDDMYMFVCVFICPCVFSFVYFILNLYTCFFSPLVCMPVYICSKCML